MPRQWPVLDLVGAVGCRSCESVACRSGETGDNRSGDGGRRRDAVVSRSDAALRRRRSNPSRNVMLVPRHVLTQGMYERILVPTDGSSGVERAIEHAIELAGTHGAAVHAVYVVNSASYGGLPMETSWEGIRDVLTDEGEEALERVHELAAGTGVEVETAVLEGSPSSRIVDYADEARCDLIVMGTHGRGGIDRLLLGSVAERVVRSADVPVLTVSVTSEQRDDEQRQAPNEASDRAGRGREPGKQV